VAAIRVSVGLVPLVRQPLGILRGGFRCAFCSSGDWRMGGVAESLLFCVGNVSRGLALLLFGRRHPRRYLLLSRPSRSLLRGTSGVQPRDSEQ
jgi:hypothetical protein